MAAEPITDPASVSNELPAQDTFSRRNPVWCRVRGLAVANPRTRHLNDSSRGGRSAACLLIRGMLSLQNAGKQLLGYLAVLWRAIFSEAVLRLDSLPFGGDFGDQLNQSHATQLGLQSMQGIARSQRKALR